MKKIEIKSLFEISDELSYDLNNLFDEKVDKEILLKLKEYKTIMNKNDYVNNHNFRSLVKRIANFFYIKDFFSIENKEIDNVILLTLDTNEKNEFIENNESLQKFKWFQSWYNHSKLDFNKDVVSGAIIKYIRKSLNGGNVIRKHYDNDYLKEIDDIFEFMYSDNLEKYPLIKCLLIFKQLFYLCEILTIDVITTLLMFVLKKYCLDINGIFNFYLSFLFNKNEYDSIEKNLKYINSLNIVEFSKLFKKAYINSIELSIYIAQKIEQHIFEINNLSEIGLDPLYGKEIKELLINEITINYPSFYMHTIYLTRQMFYKKMSEFLERGFIQIKKSNYSIHYFNNFIYNLISDIDEKKENLK